jgi:hypothetical protein
LARVGNDDGEPREFTGRNDLILRLANNLWRRGGVARLRREIAIVVKKELGGLGTTGNGEQEDNCESSADAPYHSDRRADLKSAALQVRNSRMQQTSLPIG